ncbi:glycoside hydrolase family 16 protein [Winogradskyella vincentii]|uniref:Glycoside hydrolase family 16 protein n=1 Tax=Winogradskyella vincentii TaxID=2877122 RepID=A0ABS7Y1H1_9FLAO|nr:glycoside hydrolase family 16 protein [Winogradskyella vincentii]MCA0153185.1 glycoside hydrolase family 16 protein [Winogradskyella vincentii]
MNQLFKNIATILIIPLIFFTCKENTKEKIVSTKELIETELKNDEWNLVWSDEFNSDTIDSSNWNLQVLKAGQFNNEWQRYTDSNENAFIENGSLVIKAVHETDIHGMDQYSSARLNTANKQSWKYGKIEARIKLPKGKGIWPAFWMLGANIDENGGDTPWPQCGEIDILELYGTKDNAIVEANLHYADQSNSHAMMGAKSYKLDKGIFADDFHIFALEWDDKNIKWLVDGYQYAITSIADAERSEFHKEFFILLNLAVGGTYAGRPDTSTPFPQFMYVDWVKVYQKDQSS